MADIPMRIVMSAIGGSSIISSVQSIGSSFGEGGLVGVLAKVGIAAAAAAIGLGVASVNASAAFQTAMDANVAHAGLAASQVNNVTQALMNMAPQVGQGPTQLATALYPILSSLSGITNQSAKSQVALAELKDAAESVAGSTTSTTTVTNAASAAFNAYGLQSNNTASNLKNMNGLFDVMNATVSAGNMQWSSYANMIGKLSVSSHGAGVSFNETNAALATLTNNGYSAQLAGTYLSNTYTTLYTKADTVAKNAKSLGISFDETKYKTMSLGDRLTYLKNITGGNQTELLKLMNGNSTALKTFDALSGSIGQYKGNLDSLKNSQGSTAQAFATTSGSFNMSMQRLSASGQVLLITLGNLLLPILTKIVNAITPIVSGFASWISSGQASNQVMGVLTSTGKAVMPVFNAIWSVVKVVGSVLAAEFVPLWKQVVNVYQTQLVPAFNQFLAAIKPILPQLQMFGMFVAKFIGGVVISVLFLLISTFAGVITGVSRMLPGIIQVFTGIVQIISGSVQIIGGIIAFFVDLFTGNFKKLGSDLGVIVNGIVTMFQGFWTAIVGIGEAAVQMVIGFISGWFHTLVALFTDFADKIVGHSIIPDMINAVVSWFEQLPGRVGSAVTNMVTQAVGLLNGFVTTCLNIGSNIVNGIANGITNGISTVKNAISSVTSTIGSFLPHSPAKEGELAHLNEYGPNLVKGISQGLTTSLPTLRTAMDKMTKPIGLAISSSSQPSSLPRTSGGQGQPIIVVNVNLSGVIGNKQDIANWLKKDLDQHLRRSGVIITSTSGGKAGY